MLHADHPTQLNKQPAQKFIFFANGEKLQIHTTAYHALQFLQQFLVSLFHVGKLSSLLSVASTALWINADGSMQVAVIVTRMNRSLHFQTSTYV